MVDSLEGVNFRARGVVVGAIVQEPHNKYRDGTNVASVWVWHMPMARRSS